MTASARGQIITFYSYKGGTGRSMVLANVAWILASNSQRVLVIDWDLEAPGLHRYLSPFLPDKDLTLSPGVIDFVLDYVLQAMTPPEDDKTQPDWYVPYANILRYATSLKWDFPKGGTLDFVPAGRQDATYSTRVNSFDWQDFYDRLGGGVFMNAVREKMRAEYDYILIDSRTGVSDTSGICTVQMPDRLVVCYTLNNQSIEGASAVARSAYEQHAGDKLLVFPVAMRVDNFEKNKLDRRRELARQRFARFPEHLPDAERAAYSGAVEVPYVPYYAYEEILATFGDRPDQTNSLLAAAERLTGYLTNGQIGRLVSAEIDRREEILAVYEGRALPTPAPAPSPNIPRAPVSGYIARRDKDGLDLVQRLKDELAPHKDQLVALVGPGGVGKSTVAAEAARALSLAYEQRVVWIGTGERAAFNFSTLLDEIGAQLGNPDLRALPLDSKDFETRKLVSAAPALIVVDGYEAIPPDEQARVLEWVTQRVKCAVLITTRQRIPNVRQITMDAMSPSEGREYLDRLIAQTHDPAVFKGVDRDRLIQVTGLNPLLLLWTVAQIDLAQDPGTVLDELERGEGDAAQRVFERSFNLPQLTDDGRNTLLALALFAHDATRVALAEVAGFGDDLRRLNTCLRQIASLSLIVSTDSSERVNLHPLTRSLARAHLTSNPELAAALEQRLIAYFARYVEGHAQPAPEDFDALEVELDNILGAMDIASARQDWAGLIRIVKVLGREPDGILDVRGHWDESLRWNNQAVKAAQLIGDEHAAAQFTSNAATIHLYRGEYEPATALYHQALNIFEKLDSARDIVTVTANLGQIAQAQGKSDEAQKYYQQSLELSRQLGDRRGESVALLLLGQVNRELGRSKETSLYYEQSLALSRQIGDQLTTAVTLLEIGQLEKELGNPTQAHQYFEQSLAISQQLGDQSGIASALLYIGQIEHESGDLKNARQRYEDSLSISQKIGEPAITELAQSQLKLLDTPTQEKSKPAPRKGPATKSSKPLLSSRLKSVVSPRKTGVSRDTPAKKSAAKPARKKTAR